MLKKRKGSLLPTSTAKTAWGLMADVIRAIEQEPRRVRMARYITQFHNVVGDPSAPPCGTAGCLAGWVAILGSNVSVERLIMPDANYGYGHIQNAARAAETLLDMPLNASSPQTMVPEVKLNAAERLRFPSMTHSGSEVCAFDDGCDIERKYRPGTKGYAKAVIRRARHFMKKNESHLRKTKIER